MGNFICFHVFSRRRQLHAKWSRAGRSSNADSLIKWNEENLSVLLRGWLTHPHLIFSECLLRLAGVFEKIKVDATPECWQFTWKLIVFTNVIDKFTEAGEKVEEN